MVKRTFVVGWCSVVLLVGAVAVACGGVVESDGAADGGDAPSGPAQPDDGTPSDGAPSDGASNDAASREPQDVAPPDVQSPAPCLPPPTFDPAPGTYAAAIDVELSCADPDASIFYTTDGTNPTLGSQVYSLPIHVTTATSIRAFSTVVGCPNSSVVVGNYAVDPSLDAGDQ